MKTHVAVASLLAATVWLAPGAQAQSASANVSVTELKFYEFMGMPVAKGYGDPANGAHSSYIRLPGGTVSPRHTHSADYYGVVITGVVANEQVRGALDRPLAPGSYWFQKGGEEHVTKCISQTECLFFVTSKASFDFQPVP